MPDMLHPKGTSFRARFLFSMLLKLEQVSELARLRKI